MKYTDAEQEGCFCIKFNRNFEHQDNHVTDRSQQSTTNRKHDPLKSCSFPDYGSAKGGSRRESKDEEPVSVASIIGSFGWFQLLVLVFSGIREGAVGYDALITSIMLQPEEGFLCASTKDDSDPGLIVGVKRHPGAHTFAHLLNNNISTGNDDLAQCFSDEQKQEKCQHWLFPKHDPSQASLVVEWGLVCHRASYIAIIESFFFLGLMVGNLVWGVYADRVGRKRAYLVSHGLALVAGTLAVFMPSVELFVVFRFLSALGSIGYNILYTIQMELIGTEHRSYGTMFNHLGWGLGAISIPLVASFTNSSAILLSVCPILSLIMFPCAFWLPESSRWLMAHGKFPAARKELIRAARFNGKPIGLGIENSIQALNDKILADKAQNEREQSESLEASRALCKPNSAAKDESPRDARVGGSYHNSGRNNNSLLLRLSSKQQDFRSSKLSLDSSSAASSQSGKLKARSSYQILFSNPKLVKDTLIISYSSFSGHLFYYLLTINFGHIKNLSIEANFISSGAGEWFSLVVGALLMKFLARKYCMSICLAMMAISFTFQSVIDTNLVPELNTPLIVTLNNTIGTLSSLLLVFVVLIVNQEVYPTVIRQTGSSIGNTMGEFGSFLAPWLIELNREIGLWRADLICASMCSIGMLSAFFLTKTDDLELVEY